MTSTTIRKGYVNKIVTDLIKSQALHDGVASRGNGRATNCQVLNLLHEAILNTEKFSLEEWIDLYHGLKKIYALKPHVDLIVNLRLADEEPRQQSAVAH